MSWPTKFIAAGFSITAGLAALAMLAVSVHGPAGLTIVSPIYLAAALGAIWWVARFDRVGLVLVTGAAVLAAAPGVFASLDWLERRAYDARVAATRVTDVRDESIRSASGRPIGVRVMYTVSVPKRGYFGILPSLSSQDPRAERLRVDAVRWTIDGRSDPTPFEVGKTHAMVVELYPPILALWRGVACLNGAAIPDLPDGLDASPLRLAISETTYGAVYRGAREEMTHGAYNLVDLYRGVLAVGLKPCPSA